MVGEIDLSVGSVSGFASALLGVLWVNAGWPVVLAIVAAVAAGAAIGGVYALLFNRFGMPSFVATLAGLLAVLGLQLYILGQGGSVNLPYGSPVVNFGQLYCMPHVIAYIIAALAAVGLFASGYRTAARRRAAGLSSSSLPQLLVRAGVVFVALELVVVYLNRDRGVPWMFGLFAALVVIMNYALTRTKWGRSLTAVGGNREAARRAGINVGRIYTSAFILCSVFAAVGGVLGAARLASASQQAGTGDVNLNAISAAVIGGTRSLRRSRERVFRATRHHRHPIDRERIDATRPLVIAALHDHGRGARDRRHRRFVGAQIARVARPRLTRVASLRALRCRDEEYHGRCPARGTFSRERLARSQR